MVKMPRNLQKRTPLVMPERLWNQKTTDKMTHMKISRLTQTRLQTPLNRTLSMHPMLPRLYRIRSLELIWYVSNTEASVAEWLLEWFCMWVILFLPLLDTVILFTIFFCFLHKYVRCVWRYVNKVWHFIVILCYRESQYGGDATTRHAP